MMRAILILTMAILCAGFLTGCGGGAQTMYYANNDYYPMTVGSTWTYDTKSADGTADYGETLVRVITSRRIHGDWAYGMGTHSDGTEGGFPYWSVHYTTSDESGIARRGRQLVYDIPEGGGTSFVAYAEGRVVLSRPLEVGTVWYFRQSDDPMDLCRREIVSTTATVTTPAGTFSDCLQVSQSPPKGSTGEPEHTLWYAPGVGLVRDEWINASLPPDSPDAHKIKELVSYTIVEQH